MTDICFEEPFQFCDVKPDFEFKLHIYSRVLQDDLSIASTHRKLSQKISSSVSRSLGRKFTTMKDEFDLER